MTIGNVLKNFDEVNRLNATLLKFYKENKGTDRTRTAVPFRAAPAGPSQTDEDDDSRAVGTRTQTRSSVARSRTGRKPA